MIIFVDDDSMFLNTIVLYAKRQGLYAHGVDNLQELVEFIQTHPTATIVFDGNCRDALSGLDGWDLVPTLRRLGWTGEGFALTGELKENRPKFEAVGITTNRIFAKPVDASSPIWKLLKQLVNT